MIALESLKENWVTEVKSCFKVSGDRRSKLWSFEVKKKINRSNLRECFFQAVANSSWANWGYLVVTEIVDDGHNSVMKEMRMLANAHGIGLIDLNVENPTESQITIPARERETLDWDAINRLAEENKDFLAVVKAMRQFYQTGDLHSNDWDKIQN